MQCGAAPPTGSRAKPAPLVELRGAAEDRPQVCFRIGGRGAGQQAVEDIDDGGWRHRPRAPRFGEVRDKECVATGFRQRTGHLLKPASVAVGFDHGCAVRRRRTGAEGAPVHHDCAEIDRQDAAGLGLVRPRRMRHAGIIGPPRMPHKPR